MQHESMEQLFIQALHASCQLVKTVFVPSYAEVQRAVSQGRMLIDEQALFSGLARQAKREVQRKRCHTSAAFRSYQGDHLPAVLLIVTAFTLLDFRPAQGGMQSLLVDRLRQE